MSLAFYSTAVLPGACPLLAPALAAELDADRLAGLQAALEATVPQFQMGVPGSVFSLQYQGQSIYESAVGYAVVETLQLPTMDTPFQVGSVSKLLTAVLAYQLRDHGVWSLDDPVPELGPGVTIRALLAQLSGVAREVPFNCLSTGCPGVTTEDVLAALAADVPSTLEPWERPSYSNLGFALVGQLGAAAANLSYADAMDAYVFGPLGLGGSGVYLGGAEPEGAAQGYYAGSTPLPWTDAGWEAPCGGLWSTGADLQTLNAALMGSGVGLKAATARELTSAVYLFADEVTYVGSPVESLLVAGRRVRCKEGTLTQFGAMACTVPELGLSLAFLVNEGIDSTAIAYGALQVAVPLVEGMLGGAPAPVMPAEPDAYEGVWASAATGDYLVISSAGSYLSGNFLGAADLVLSAAGDSTLQVLLQTSQPSTSCGGLFGSDAFNAKLQFSFDSSPPTVDVPALGWWGWTLVS